MNKFKEIFEAKMSDADITSACKKLVANGNEKTKAFAQGMLDYRNKEGNNSYHPNQVSGLQNIMKNSSWQLSSDNKKD